MRTKSTIIIFSHISRRYHCKCKLHIKPYLVIYQHEFRKLCIIYQTTFKITKHFKGANIRVTWGEKSKSEHRPASKSSRKTVPETATSKNKHKCTPPSPNNRSSQINIQKKKSERNIFQQHSFYNFSLVLKSNNKFYIKIAI